MCLLMIKRFLLLTLTVCSSLGLCLLLAAWLFCRIDPTFGWMCQEWVPVQAIITVGLCFTFAATLAISLFLFKIFAIARKMAISYHLALYVGVIAAVALSATSLRHYRSQYVERRRLSDGVGTVTSVETRILSDRGWKAWKFHYTYQVAGVDYFGSDISYFDLRRHQCAALRNAKTSDGQLMKSPVHVFYNPDHPEKSAMYRWTSVPSEVEAALTVSLILFGLYSLFLCWRFVGFVSQRWNAEARSGQLSSPAEQEFVRSPYALPVLVALTAYGCGTYVFGLNFGDCGDPAMGGYPSWFGRYGACLFGAMCATAGSALWPKDIISFSLGKVSFGKAQAKTTSAELEMLKDPVCLKQVMMLMVAFVMVSTGCFLASLNAAVVVMGADNVPLYQMGMFVALWLSAVFVLGTLGVFLYRFCPVFGRELALRRMTLSRWVGRMLVHAAIVALAGFVVYHALN